MSVSALVVSNALDDEPRLILSAAEQRRLLEEVRQLRCACEALLEPLPRLGLTPREAIEVLVQACRVQRGDDPSLDLTTG